MEIQRFDANTTSGEDRFFRPYGKKLYQRHIDSFNEQGYKLYCYKDFKLIEITNLKEEKKKGDKIPWGDEWNVWGPQVFFLNDKEYEHAMKVTNKAKELHDKILEQAKTIAEIPLATIYSDILKIK